MLFSLDCSSFELLKIICPSLWKDERMFGELHKPFVEPRQKLLFAVSYRNTLSPVCARVVSVYSSALN